ncbi:hypothetical protein IB241_22850 [Pseudomonas sp. PDM05]|jgi:hypothetical protein|uniref:hypothetical protein n=1 Tax=Pseudomonas sp. PDM05 TaxID=2769301 RepID=UPI001784F568|nr:hypothetical protein [Pseudomonas sp. PDM05]MBD9460535.1 hypothetical protein [Pseudomonas sp. PDM05]
MLKVCKFILIGTCALISACSGVPYAPKGSTMYQGGYSDEKTGTNTYTVNFEGNAYNQQDQPAVATDRHPHAPIRQPTGHGAEHQAD